MKRNHSIESNNSSNSIVSTNEGFVPRVTQNFQKQTENRVVVLPDRIPLDDFKWECIVETDKETESLRKETQ